MNISDFHSLFGRNMQLQTKFHLQPNSCFAGKLDWERDVTLNPGKRRCFLMNLECNWDDIFGGLNQPTIFYNSRESSGESSGLDHQLVHKNWCFTVAGMNKVSTVSIFFSCAWVLAVQWALLSTNVQTLEWTVTATPVWWTCDTCMWTANQWALFPPIYNF